MGRIISGRTAFIAAIIGTAGVVGGLWWMLETFCLISCTLTEQRASDNALFVTVLSFLLLAATVVVAAKAIRRGAGRSWAIAALWVGGIPVAVGAIGVPLLFVVLGF